MNPKYRRSLVALAVATASTTAYAQSPCDQQIQQIEQRIQQQQLNQQRQMEVRDLLQAAKQPGSDCQAYVDRARELLAGGTQTAPTSTAQQSIPPVRSPASGQQHPESPQQPARVAEPAQPVQPERPVAQQNAPSQPSRPEDRTLDVQVDQAPADVDVQTRSPQIVVKQQPAEVTVEQKPPEVEITQQEPQISVKQPKPEVQVDRAQPDVEVTQSDPQVEVRQSEPNVRVVQPEATARVETDRAGRQNQQQPQVSLQDVKGSPVLSSQGEEIGEVQEFVRSTRDGTAHALIAVGGVLGVGERDIAIPLDQVRLTEEGHLQTDLSQQELEQQQEYDEQQFEQIQQSEFAALEAELQSRQ